MRGLLLLLLITPLGTSLDMKALLSRYDEREWVSPHFLDREHDLDSMFDWATFGMDLETPCEVMTTSRFRKLMNAQVERCDGEFCHDDQFSCPAHSRGDCFHVEHIVDEGGPEFTTENCDKNFAGNYVMAWGRWNSALGGHARTRRGYLEVTMEKAEVYGLDRVLRARELIERCNPGCTNDWRPPV